jgi:hypothetical protein
MRAQYAGLLVLLMVAMGCARWQPQGLTPRAVIERDHPDQVRITLRDSSRMDLRAPVIRGDTLRGLTEQGDSAFALSDVSYVSLKGGNKAAVAALSGVGVAAGLIALLAATWD